MEQTANAMVIARRIADGLAKNPIANRIPSTNSEKDAMNPKKVWKDSTLVLFDSCIIQ